MKFIRRLKAAFGTPVSCSDKILTLRVGIYFAGIAFPFGFISGFLNWGLAPVSPGRALILVTAALLTPALAEEVLFRALLLPSPCEAMKPETRLFWSFLSLSLFVSSHPLKVLLFRRNVEVFTDTRFLLMATLLGGACTFAYLRTGSLWPPVLIHWLAVVAWLLFLGGYARMF